jgi:putative membrane-bound dehydrogenase-like protein
MKRKLSFCLVLLSVLSLGPAARVLRAADTIGIKPLGNDGKALNLDFEAGTLRDWTATGTAFTNQPVKGDTVNPRRADMKSQHQGNYWIGTYEFGGDDVTGTLTSVPFKVTHPWASFLVAGGPYPRTKVELIVKEGSSERVVFAASGNETENLEPVVANLKPYVGKEMFIRILDEQKASWGHINFDNFLFHESEPRFPKRARNPAQDPSPPLDNVRFAGLSGEEAAKEMTLPPGFRAILFAGEPDVVQPIAFCIDDRGRVWVVEGRDYPKRAPEGEGKDRILIFDDTDGDGKFNKCHVFMEKLNLVSGIEVGFGGVWIGAAPHLMFVPVKNWDEPKPAGEPKILLDGWDYKHDTHETLNTFTWGPDGWLYGCHGVFCPSLVGKPGAPESERQWVDAAVWRYHPTKHTFEVFAEGTSNPWGIDYDERGQFFIEACVVPHFWHVIQGARYQRQGGEHYCLGLEETTRNERHRDAKSRKPRFPYIYADIQAHGDHVHWTGSKGPHAGNSRSDSAGGGHAHAGLLVYQGSSWPEQYQGKIFMNNIHGQRINMDISERKGSGYVGRHGADLINFNDTWSQVLNLLTGPDGSVYMIDWYDKNQCHHNDINGHDRSNGRIFKIVHGDPKWKPVDLQKKEGESVTIALFGNDWESRHARRILLENYQAQEKLLDPVRKDLKEEDRQREVDHVQKLTFSSIHQVVRGVLLDEKRSGKEQLRALWSLHLTRGLDAEVLPKVLFHTNEYVRAWTIQLVCEDNNPSEALLKEFSRLAKEDPSPVVRLYLASACQRLTVEQRLPILENLVAHAEDANDHNLPLMYWYAAEAVAAQGPLKAVPLLTKTKIPQVREFIARRMAAASNNTASTN